jgi:hypothetical protein
MRNNSGFRRQAFDAARRPVLRRGWRYAVLLLGVQCVPWLGQTAAQEAESPWYRRLISGQSRSVYQYQSAGDEKDSDFYEYLYVRGHDLAYNHLDFYFSGKLHRDLDGTSASLSDDLFSSVEDRGPTTESYLYQGYVELRDQAKKIRFRAGRQYVDIADSLHIDGAQLMVYEDAKLGGRVFGGQPVSFYSSVSGDWAGGASLVGRPWEGNETRLTYVRYHDDSENADDERYGLDMRQQWQDDWRFRGLGSVLNDRFETAGLDLFYAPTDTDFDGSLCLRRWGGVNGESRAYSPLHRVLGDLKPYTYVTARLSKGLLPWLFLSPGFAARLVSDADADARNRDYERYDLTLSAEPNRTWNISVAGEYWNVDQGDSFFGVSGEVRYRHRKVWEVSAGTGYVHYEYAQYSDFTGTIDAGDVRVTSDGTRIESSPDSYSYFLRGKWNVTQAVSVQARVDLEDDSEVPDVAFRGQTALVIRF